MRENILRRIGRSGATGHFGTFETVGLASAATLCSALWVGVAVPTLSVLPGSGSDSSRSVSIALESALLGIDDGSGRRVAADSLSARFGVLASGRLLPTPAGLRLATYELTRNGGTPDDGRGMTVIVPPEVLAAAADGFGVSTPAPPPAPTAPPPPVPAPPPAPFVAPAPAPRANPTDGGKPPAGTSADNTKSNPPATLPDSSGGPLPQPDPPSDTGVGTSTGGGSLPATDPGTGGTDAGGTSTGGTGTGGTGTGNGVGNGNGNGQANGQGNGVGNGGVGNGNGNGQANGQGNGVGNGGVGNGNGNGQANGQGNGVGNGAGNGNGNANGAANGNANANGAANGNANANGAANGNGNANANGAANGNGNANGHAKQGA